MNQKKLFITGRGIISSLGNSCQETFTSLLNGHSGIKKIPEWLEYRGLKSCLLAPAKEYDDKQIPRTLRRGMSRMSEMAYLATLQALQEAQIDLKSPPWAINNGRRCLLAVGSSTGSVDSYGENYRKFFEKGHFLGQDSNAIFKTMSHSVALNLAIGLNFSGPSLPLASACSTSSHSLAMTIELMNAGLYDFAIIGGADETGLSSLAVFDNLQAASRNFTNGPSHTPRPFDKDRDGLVLSEGAGILIIETEEHLQKRGVQPLSQVLGGAYYCDGRHLTQQQQDTMSLTMEWAIEHSDLNPIDIGYVNAHATATRIGDVEEALAIQTTLPHGPLVSSLKGHFGHSTAACGAIELIATSMMMDQSVFIGTRNLEILDPACKNINAIKKNTEATIQYSLSNNYAFGGINASIVLGKV